MQFTHPVDRAAHKILLQNDKGRYTVPTDGLYPYQWNWDSAFAAVGFARFDLNRAWTELETLLAGQWSNGMVPHILFHEPDPRYFPGPDIWGCNGPIASSGISQPPVAATIASQIFDQYPNESRERVALLFDQLVAWHSWFMTYRQDNGAICVTHPWEAGRDNAPDWDGAMASIDPVNVGEYTRRDTSHVDSAMRPKKYDYDRYIWLVQQGRRLDWDEHKLAAENPFRVADPTMTFILLRAQRDLARLGRSLGRDVSEIESQIRQLESGVRTLWNDDLGAFDARDVRSGQWSNSISNASFLCWYAGIESPEMRDALKKVMHGMQYGIPSFNPHDSRFDGQRYWRGPVWVIMNMMIGLGMQDMGMKEGATLRTSTAELIANHGFAEYFDPRDGTPAGGQLFTWTAAVWLAWASPTLEVQ